MTLFIDFDRTLFDTHRFRKELVRLKLLPLLFHVRGDAYKKFLYEDTIHFLETHTAHTIVLVTAGFRPYQFLKVNRSGIVPYFSDVVYSKETPKGAIIRRYQAGNATKSVFVDDNPHHLISVQCEVPDTTVVRMRRKNEPYSGERDLEGVPEVTNLYELTIFLRELKI